MKDPKSYRPICLLPVIEKLFEKLLKMHLTDIDAEKGTPIGSFMLGRSMKVTVVDCDGQFLLPKGDTLWHCSLIFPMPLTTSGDP